MMYPVRRPGAKVVNDLGGDHFALRVLTLTTVQAFIDIDLTGNGASVDLMSFVPLPAIETPDDMVRLTRAEVGRVILGG